MKTKMLMLAAVAGAALAWSATANAAVTYTPYGAETLSTVVALSPVSSTGTGYLIQSGSNGQGAAPELSSGPDAADYLSVLGGGSATIDLAPGTDEFSVYVGSLDTYNTISFTGPGATGPYTGSELLSVSGATLADSGNQSSSLTNGLFTFTFAQPVSAVTFASTSNSLEIASAASSISAAPEPASWALMLLGVGGLGLALRSNVRGRAFEAVRA